MKFTHYIIDLILLWVMVIVIVVASFNLFYGR